MTRLEVKMRKELVRFLVQKTIFCPNTGEVLDMDTCVVLLKEGDPAYVISQTGWRKCRRSHASLADSGVTADPATVKP